MAPVLTLPMGSKGFVVYFYTSRLWFGSALMKHGRVIAFASRQLKVREKNYSPHELELAAMVFILKIWRHYLYGVHVNVLHTTKVSNMYLIKRS